MGFIKLIDADTNMLALVNPENITHISRINDVYSVHFYGDYINISDADFARLCSAVGYVVGNGSEPSKSVELHSQTLAALMGLWNEFKELDDYIAHGEFAISNNAATRITRHIMNARSIMSDWQKPGDFQVPPHDQNPTYIPDALGGLGAYPDRESEDDDDILGDHIFDDDDDWEDNAIAITDALYDPAHPDYEPDEDDEI